jgi:hypothetical protein
MESQGPEARLLPAEEDVDEDAKFIGNPSRL